MPGHGLALTDANMLGLFFSNRYRFLTIAQFAKASELSRDRSEALLLKLWKRDIVGSFGNVVIAGHGKTSKVYYLKRRGWEILRAESGIPEEMIGSFREVHQEASWSPLMYHRLHLLDVMIAAELSVRARRHLNLARTFLEYCRVKLDRRLMRETADYVSGEEAAENRIIPDGAFIIENIESGRRGLFLIEMDMGTERLVSSITHDRRQGLHFRFEQYDKYLSSLRFAEKYAGYGKFESFTLLFVTVSEGRLANVRASLADLREESEEFYLFGLFGEVVEDFLGEVWRGRSPTDAGRYRLVADTKVRPQAPVFV